MSEVDRRAEWERMAPLWIARCAEGETNRVGFLDRAMWACIGPVTGLQAIDIGCGEGRFSRMLAERGAAEVLGVDLCTPLLAAAEQLKKTAVEQYRMDDMQTLATVPDGSFDLAVSYVALVDVPDVPATVRAAYRVLRPGGRYVVCNLAPMATATNARTTDSDGRRFAIRVAGYFDESVRVMRFGKNSLSNFHRTLTTYMTAFLQAGFQLQSLTEPQPTAAEIARYPDIANEVEAPSFILYDLRKPT